MSYEPFNFCAVFDISEIDISNSHELKRPKRRAWLERSVFRILAVLRRHTTNRQTTTATAKNYSFMIIVAGRLCTIEQERNRCKAVARTDKKRAFIWIYATANEKLTAMPRTNENLLGPNRMEERRPHGSGWESVKRQPN